MTRDPDSPGGYAWRVAWLAGYAVPPPGVKHAPVSRLDNRLWHIPVVLDPEIALNAVQHVTRVHQPAFAEYLIRQMVDRIAREREIAVGGEHESTSNTRGR